MDAFASLRYYRIGDFDLSVLRPGVGMNMNAPLLHDIEAKISELSMGEKQALFDRLGDHLRAARKVEFAAALSAMAADPDIQRAIREIDQEFADAAEDGLENM